MKKGSSSSSGTTTTYNKHGSSNIVYAPVVTQDDEFGAATAAAAVVEAVAVIPPLCLKVEAPTALPGGYVLAVHTNNSTSCAMVRVPEPGVCAGQVFCAESFACRGAATATSGSDDSRDENPHAIPMGRWRDGLWDFCAHGCCHPLCCLTYCVRPLALGQVMHRLKLTPCGNRMPTEDVNANTTISPFSVMAALVLFLYIFNNAFPFIIPPPPPSNNNGEVPADTSEVPIPWSSIVSLCFYIFVNVAASVYILWMTCKTRNYLRRVYAIPSCCSRNNNNNNNGGDGCGGWWEDACCSFWCGCCVVAQMARHTVDYRNANAACCTEDGLGEAHDNYSYHNNAAAAMRGRRTHGKQPLAIHADIV